MSFRDSDHELNCATDFGISMLKYRREGNVNLKKGTGLITAYSLLFA